VAILPILANCSKDCEASTEKLFTVHKKIDYFKTENYYIFYVVLTLLHQKHSKFLAIATDIFCKTTFSVVSDKGYINNLFLTFLKISVFLQKAACKNLGYKLPDYDRLYSPFIISGHGQSRMSQQSSNTMLKHQITPVFASSTGN